MWNDSMKGSATSASPLQIGTAAAATLGLLFVSAVLADEKPTSGPKVARALKEAHDDLNAKKYSDAILKLKEAEGIAGKTPYDQHLINDMLGFAYIRTQDFPDAAKALEAELHDGYTPPADVPPRVRVLTQLNYQIKNYDKAIEYGTRAVKAGDLSPGLDTLVGQAYYLKGDWKGTRDFEDELVNSQIKRGETPAKGSLQLTYSACVKLHENECATRALERLKRYYPGTDPIAPQVPVGTLLAYFFGTPEDVGSLKRSPTSQHESKETK